MGNLIDFTDKFDTFHQDLLLDKIVLKKWSEKSQVVHEILFKTTTKCFIQKVLFSLLKTLVHRSISLKASSSGTYLYVRADSFVISPQKYAYSYFVSPSVICTVQKSFQCSISVDFTLASLSSSDIAWHYIWTPSSNLVHCPHAFNSPHSTQAHFWLFTPHCYVPQAQIISRLLDLQSQSDYFLHQLYASNPHLHSTNPGHSHIFQKHFISITLSLC